MPHNQKICVPTMSEGRPMWNPRICSNCFNGIYIFPQVLFNLEGSNQSILDAMCGDLICEDHNRLEVSPKRSKGDLMWFYWILLNSLHEKEYETFPFTLINDRQSFNYNEVSSTLVNYEVRRQDILSSSKSTTAETLAVRDRSSNRKGRGDQRRSKSRPDFRYLKKNQCILCKELWHWRIDCSKATGKKKKSKTEANLAQVISTHAGTSQADGSD